MANKEKFDSVVLGLGEALAQNGFTKADTPDEKTVIYRSDKGTLKVTADDNKIYMFSSDFSPEDSTDDSYTRISMSLLEDSSDESDIRYIVSDFTETIQDKFTEKQLKRKNNNYKAPPTISKNAVKGGMSYDANTLVSRVCQIYPELKDEYKNMVAKYGEVLGDEFFTLYGNKPIINTIKSNNPQQMKKLFNVLNDIYDDGSNDVQDIIAVTIMGALDNDQVLIANCVDYMSEDMAPVVISVNKYLASSSGKRMKKKFDNPPAYKPKKQRKGLMSRMMAAQNSGLNQ